MRAAPNLMLVLLTVAALSTAPGCASKVVEPTFLAARDLQVEAKPRLDPAALESERALNEFDSAIEAWGERGWNAVGRLCRQSAALGMRIDCPAAPPDG